MNPKPKALQNSLAERYLLRLKEAAAVLYPDLEVAHPEVISSLDDFSVLARSLARFEERPMLGLEFGLRITLADYGAVGLAMASSRNLNEALNVQLEYLAVITNTSRFRYQLAQKDAWMILELREATPSYKLDEFTIETEFGAQLRLIKDLLPWADISKCVMRLPYACPTTRNEYTQRAKCAVRFTQSQAMLQVPHSWFEQQLDSADEVLSQMLADRCQLVLNQMTQEDDWVQLVRSFLLTSESPKQSLETTAMALGVSTAKLRWCLAKSQTSYKEIVLGVKMHLACRYLEDTPLTLQQISYRLGYTYPSNFQLAFKRYFNCTPGKWRQDSGQ